ncbi:2625_t:CDS:1 [Dentiscutata erythropus]|uniref:2625_t:CDS:1 n=1 Tax=Dentiscutata erythropus TaxID=1348616 RepID=A0A9N9NC74_9GLOM|nr:2625_t:CDS:1 [Dentiscutata erythropus]
MSSQERQNLQQSQNSQTNQKHIEVFFFEKMSPKTRKKLKYARKSFDFGQEIHMYFHITLGTYYALRSIDLSQAVYTVEHLTFSLIANKANNLLKLKEWVFKTAQELGIDIEGVIRSGIDSKFIENIK